MRLDEKLEIADVLQAEPPGRLTTRPFGNLMPARDGGNSAETRGSPSEDPASRKRKAHAALSFWPIAASRGAAGEASAGGADGGTARLAGGSHGLSSCSPSSETSIP